jgi:hypothetical protein
MFTELCRANGFIPPQYTTLYKRSFIRKMPLFTEDYFLEVFMLVNLHERGSLKDHDIGVSTIL